MIFADLCVRQGRPAVLPRLVLNSWAQWSFVSAPSVVRYMCLLPCPAHFCSCLVLKLYLIVTFLPSSPPLCSPSPLLQIYGFFHISDSTSLTHVVEYICYLCVVSRADHLALDNGVLFPRKRTSPTPSFPQLPAVLCVGWGRLGFSLSSVACLLMSVFLFYGWKSRERLREREKRERASRLDILNRISVLLSQILRGKYS